MKRRIRHNWQVGLMAALATLLYFGFPSTVLASEIHEVKVEAEAGEADEISETSEVAETRETNEAGEVSETNEENSATTFEKDAPPEIPPPPEIKSALSTAELESEDLFYYNKDDIPPTPPAPEMGSDEPPRPEVRSEEPSLEDQIRVAVHEERMAEKKARTEQVDWFVNAVIWAFFICVAIPSGLVGLWILVRAKFPKKIR